MVGLDAVYTQGNLGVGTAAPAALLHVAGTARFDGAVTLAPTVRTITIGAAAFQGNGAAPTTLMGGAIPGVQRPGLGKAQGWAPVSLPHGAVVTNVAASFYDDSTVDVEVKLYRTGFATPGGVDGALATVPSTGATGYQMQSDATIDLPTIDNATYFYHLWVSFPDEPGAKTLALYAVKITYTVTAPLP